MANSPINTRRAPALRWMYALALLPTAAEFVERGGLPHQWSGIISTSLLSLVIGGGVHVIARQADRLARLTLTDTLTQLKNRQALERDLEREVARAKRFGQPLTLAYVDVDHFKAIFDSWGGREAKRVLQRVAALLKRNTREQVDSCYRLYGEKFALLLPGSTVSDATEVLRRIEQLARGAPTRLEEYGAGLSLGAVDFRPDESWEGFLNRADSRMYEAMSSTPSADLGQPHGRRATISNGVT